MNLPRNIPRCDGLLPKQTQLDGKSQILWSIDCPRREECARFCQLERDDPEAEAGTYHYTAHHHAPGDACPDFIAELQDAKAE